MSNEMTFAVFLPNVVGYDALGALQAYVVPATGIYEVIADGAQGDSGNHGVSPTDVSSPRGLGGEAEAKLALKQGETLEIAVGQTGGSVSSAYLLSSGQAGAPYVIGGMAGGGGGGGSFVVLSSGAGDTPLVVAGGGGGGASSSLASFPQGATEAPAKPVVA